MYTNKSAKYKSVLKLFHFKSLPPLSPPPPLCLTLKFSSLFHHILHQASEGLEENLLMIFIFEFHFFLHKLQFTLFLARLSHSYFFHQISQVCVTFIIFSQKLLHARDVLALFHFHSMCRFSLYLFQLPLFSQLSGFHSFF